MSHISSEDVRVLVEIGFIALSAGEFSAAAEIFQAVASARPEQEAGPLGLAMTDMAKGDLTAAIRKLRQLPPTDAASTYLAIALSRQGDIEGARTILEDVRATADDETFRTLAADTLATMQDAPFPDGPSGPAAIV